MARNRQSQGVNLAAVFAGVGLPRPAQEVEFHPSRKWRWDLAWPDHLVALERQGGTWAGGRHTRGQGYRDDAEKLAHGQVLGWLVIYATADMLADGSAFSLVRLALESRGWPRIATSHDAGVAKG